MSNTLGSFSKGLMDLSNMFNLDKLASMNNSGLNKFINDKISVQNEMMKQFGFETKSQYIDFKNGLDSTLANMGSLYNGTDLKNYMSNLSSMGITNTKMAQDQMRASIMGTKYLGVSAETQTEMFKWMKRTNDYDMLDEHNKVITGLLKSQLGVSKEQLDALSLIAYGELESKSALGMSPEAVQAQSEASSIMGAVLTNMYDAKTAGAIQSALNDFMINPGDSGWISTFGGNYQSIYDSLFTSNTREGQLNAMYKFLQGIQNSGLLNVTTGNGGLTTAIGNKRTNALTSLGDDVIAALQGNNFNGSKYLDLQQQALDGVLEGNDEQFIQETTEITWLENIYNRLDKFFTSIDSVHLVSLANTAFTLFIASKAFDVYSKIKDLGLIPQLFNSSKAMTTLGSVGKGIIANGGGILLGAGAAAVIAGAIMSTANKSSSEEATKNAAIKNNNKSIFGKGIDLFGAGISNSAGLVGTGIGTVFGDDAVLAKSKWLRVASNYTSGLYEPEDAVLYRLAALMMFDKADWLRYTKNTETHNDIVSKYNSLSDSEKKRVKQFVQNDDDLAKLAGLTINSIDWSNYHKAGLKYVPRDNYKALLHKGEMVLSEEEARRYRGIGGVESVGPHATGTYGMNHKGIDVYFGQIGTPVGSAVPGIVVDSSDIPYNPNDGKKYHGADTNGNRYSSYGRVVKIKGDNDNLTYIYGHLNQRMVGIGQHVNAGDLIGYSGTTGNSSGPHLHFEIAGHGAGFNNHAPWFTSSVRNIGDTSGAVEQPSTSNTPSILSDGSTSSTIASSGIPVRTGRFSIFNNSSTKNTGMGGADRIVNSVNGGFGRLMSYLDSIRQEQDVQREMISAFSRTNTESTI